MAHRDHEKGTPLATPGDVHPQHPLLSMTGYLLHRAGMLLVAEAEAELARRGLRVRYFFVMSALDVPAELSQQDLSSLLGLDPGAMVSIIDEMEGRGHVERRRNPQDRRRYIVTLTDEGRGTLTESRAAMEQIEQRFLGALTGTEQGSLRGLLEKALEPTWPDLVRCP
jgi:DNA-binding MarR family transcriptional regulator